MVSVFLIFPYFHSNCVKISRQTSQFYSKKPDLSTIFLRVFTKKAPLSRRLNCFCGLIYGCISRVGCEITSSAWRFEVLSLLCVAMASAKPLSLVI